ncbi:hypothetical protein MasN3_34910 [Massilia varians]|uniref:Uncharacterized protein n=1 Tax=Massilia varians TaxID=457921 RepID=A0ABM8C9N9_9BURK|nr:hypothetical protein MasN3_34910 [Massilia varians]
MERNCEPMDKNRIEGAAEQGERATFREALVVKARRRKFGGCAGKECVLTGRSRLVPERGDGCQWQPERESRSEKSAEVVVGAGMAGEAKDWY